MLANAAAISSEKSPEAFRTISEVASDIDVPQHVLRFWEGRFTQIKPIKRAGGRRYYRPEDVDLLRAIRSLLYSEGYTIKGVQKVLREKGLRYVSGLGRALATAEPTHIAAVYDDEPRYARAALMKLERAHAPEPAPAPTTSSLAEEERVRLEILLAELLQMKSRLRTALSASTV